MQPSGAGDGSELSQAVLMRSIRVLNDKNTHNAIIFLRATHWNSSEIVTRTQRAELIKFVAPLNYNMAFKLAQEILDPYELAKANIYLAVSKN